MKSAVTQLLKYEIVSDIKSHIFPVLANTYVGIGRPIRWGDEFDPESLTEIEDVQYTTDYRNQIFRDMIAIKKVEPADIALVVPRRNWESGISYDVYDNNIELFSHVSKLSIGTIDANNNIVTQNNAIFTGNISVGNIITFSTETKEVISVNTTTLVLNTDVSTAYVNVAAIRIDNTYPQFANNFYVRNSRDQVFICLFNANTISTVEPTIDIDGQLPENPYIRTGDNYKWKYLYTIPYGLKQKFFTTNWMPVISDAAVVAGSENGRIDVINILDGGSGYFLNNGESGNSNSLSILTVTGDGSGAIVTAKIQSGVITELNILNGGTDYTTAEIIVDDPDQLANGNVAVFGVPITPYGGHGSNPVKELGCYSVMTSVDIIGTESGTIPVGSDTSEFDFRQISLLRDPLLANGVYANASVLRTTTKLVMTDPGITNYVSDETVYIGTSLENASMTATVVNWEPVTNELYVNNISGNVVVGSTLTGDDSAAGATILEVVSPDITLFAGDVLYIENRDKIVRDVNQTEQIRLVLSF